MDLEYIWEGAPKHGMLSSLAQVEALVKRNHERAAEARSAFLPLLHPEMLDAAPHSPSNGLSSPAIKVRACAAAFPFGSSH